MHTMAYLGLFYCNLVLMPFHYRCVVFNFQRVQDDIPMSYIMAGARNRLGVSKEEMVVGWLLDLASVHDPQPDRDYTILGCFVFFISNIFLLTVGVECQPIVAS